MNQNPKCRDAFIAAMEASGGHYDLSWYSLVIDANSTDWRWSDGVTEQIYRDGFCLAYKPPRDVDPETVLGRLRRLLDAGVDYILDVRDPRNIDIVVSVPKVIDLIESLQQERDAFKEEATRQAKEKLMQMRKVLNEPESARKTP